MSRNGDPMTPRSRAGRPMSEALCSDCPPIGYLTDRTRCSECPRRMPTNDEMAAELEAAGWTRAGIGRYRAPNGALYIGPFQAWKAMNGILLHEGVFGECRS